MSITRRTMLKNSVGMGLGMMMSTSAYERAGGGSRGQDADEPAAVPSPEPRIARFERMAFGMFVHWGLYSQIGAGEWAKHMQGIATDEYMKLMKTFTAADFDGRTLARLAKRAGMKYITHTSRHHDGFSLYDTRGLSKYDVINTPAGRDLILDFVEGCRVEGIVPMLYCTTLDWTDPRFSSDFPAYLQYLRDSVEILCTNYGPIGGFWFDGNWSRRDADWEEDALYAVIRKHQPEAMIINNTGIGSGGKVGHPEIDSVTFERGRPEPLDRSGWSKYVAGEMCHTMNFHWGIAVNDFNYLSPAHVIEELCLCRRAGANLLMNIGPTATGGIPEYEAAALKRVGDWIVLHGGENCPLYRGRPCGISGQEHDFALEMDGEVFLFVFNLTSTSNTQAHGDARGPGPRTFTGVNRQFSRAIWMDNDEELTVENDPDNRRLVLHATRYPYGTNTVVRIARLVP
ncbi:MAG: alpha-L-fucosidase [Phycisphaerales bacterium]|nr:MAG: alpha-L-fucosidase [Phycisphaerales bacterium]